MADKHTPSGAAGRAQTADQPDAIRNVVLIGPSGSGKTTLVEALLAYTGVIARPGRVENGTTVSDFDEVEHRQQRSTGLSLAPIVHEGVKINIIDTPGYADFTGELRAGLRAADCALFVISAADGVDGATKALWAECSAVGMPRAVVICKLDHQRADYPAALAQAQAAFGNGVVPLYVPVPRLEEGIPPTGLVGLLSGQLFDYSSGERSAVTADATDAADAADAMVEPDIAEQVELERATLIESIIEESEDETLMDRYLDGGDLDPKELIDDLEIAVAKGAFFPVLPVSAFGGLGIPELLEVITGGFPAPLEHPLPAVMTPHGVAVPALTCDPDGPLLAEVVKTSSDPYVGRINLVRVFSGTIRPDAALHISGHSSEFFGDRGHADHDEDEKVGSLSSPLGKVQRTLDKCIAGDICAIGKLSRAETGDTISSPDRPLLMKPWSMPEALLPIAITAHAKADEDKLSLGLSRLGAEDPTLRIEQNAETHQLVLWCMGDAHVDVMLDRLANRYGVQVDQVPLRVPLRETFAEKTTAKARHKKQSGGHGQFGECFITVEPLPEGSGFEFVDKVVGGDVPRQFIPSVEKGLRIQMERGIVAGYPVVDLRVVLTGGSAHSVDSSDMAFQTAGALALREAAKNAQISLLEPVDLVTVLIDDEHVGQVMGDLSSRRGRVLGTEPVPGGRTMVKAEVPQLEVTTYSSDLRSMSHGTGTFSRVFARYEAMPSHIAQKVRAEQAEDEEKHRSNG